MGVHTAHHSTFKTYPAKANPQLRLQYFVHLMQRANSLEKTLILGKTEGRRRRG